MKKPISMLLVILSVFIVSSCIDEDNSATQKQSKYFSFATTKIYHLNLDYKTNSNQKIRFEIYKDFPLDTNGEKLSGISPLTKGFTDRNGKANFDVSMITGLNNIYIYTQQLGVPSLMLARVINNTISFVEDANTKASIVYTTDQIDTFWNTSLGGWTRKGLPAALMQQVDNIPAHLLTDIKNTLPERTSVFTNHPSLIRENVSTKIIKTSNVYVTFVHEGAKYRNSMGYFCYQTNNPPQSVASITPILLFPDASYKNDYTFGSSNSGCLFSGNKIQLKYRDPFGIMLDTFPSGVSIGWVMVSNGFNPNASIGLSTRNKDIFYSLSQFNPENNTAQRQHCVLLYDEETQLSVIGFEDTKYNNSSDHDFNDVLFYASANPITAIEPPADHVIPASAPVFDTINYHGTVAYEDLWPSKGDYDMNDLVVDYNINQIIDTNNRVISSYGTYTLVHVGAQLYNGFGFQLGIDDSRVSTFTLSPSTDVSSLITKNAKGLEAQQNLATAILFTNATDIITRSEASRTYSFRFDFNEPITNTLLIPPYNPFIMVNSGKETNPIRNHELHLPYFAPTSKMDISLFGTCQDKSNVSQKMYYVSDEKFPFAIHIPTSYAVPTESTRIDVFYPKFNSWVRSNGVTNSDWYLYPITANKSNIVRR